MAFVKAANVGELEEGTGKQLTVGGKPIALFLSAGKYYALDAICTHRNAPLAEGYVEGTEVECPWHAARFDLTTGAALCRPATKGVGAYAVQVVGDEIQVDV